MIYDIQQRMMYEIIKPFEGHAIETDRESSAEESYLLRCLVPSIGTGYSPRRKRQIADILADSIV